MDRTRILALLSNLYSVCRKALHEISLDEWEHPALDQIEDAISLIENTEGQNSGESNDYIPATRFGSMAERSKNKELET